MRGGAEEGDGCRRRHHVEPRSIFGIVRWRSGGQAEGTTEVLEYGKGFAERQWTRTLCGWTFEGDRGSGFDECTC